MPPNPRWGEAIHSRPGGCHPGLSSAAGSAQTESGRPCTLAKQPGRAQASPPRLGEVSPGWNPEVRRRSLLARPSFLTQSTALPPPCGPQGTGVTLGPNKGPPELLSATGRRGRGGAGRARCPPPHLAGALEETKVALSGLPGAPEDGPGCAGVQAALRPPSLPSNPWPSPASPKRERAPPESAVFPSKAGIPGRAQTKRERGRSTPRASQATAWFTCEFEVRGAG